MQRKRRAFTLIELIVVIAIIIILAAIAIPNFVGMNKKAQSAQCKANRTIIERQYIVQNVLDSAISMEDILANAGGQYFGGDVSCSQGGVYSAVYDGRYAYVRCSIHGVDMDGARAFAFDSDSVYEQMKYILENYSSMSKEEREEISSYPNNDRFRTYLLQKKFGGSWPTIPEAIRSAYNITSKEDAPLYIQPYSVDPTDPSQAFVYASTVPGNGNWNTNLVYDHEEKTWYYNPKGTFSCTMPWAQVKARIHSDGWQALR